MKILVAMPLYGRLEIAAQAINELTKTDSDHTLSFAFLIHENPELKTFITSTVNNPAFKKRFSKSFILKTTDTGFPLQNLVLLRNLAFNFAGKNEFDALWFVDSDILVQANFLELLLNVDSGIASGLYRLKIEYVAGEQAEFFDERKNFFLFLPEFPREIDVTLMTQPFVVDTVAAGCLLIKKEALGKSELNFDCTLPKWQEDYNFCFKAKRLGLTIKIHPLCFCEHIPAFIECSKNALINLRTGELMFILGKKMFPALEKCAFTKTRFWSTRRTVSKCEMVTFSKKRLGKIASELATEESEILLVQLRKNAFLVLSGFKKVAALKSGDQVDVNCFTPAQKPGLPADLLQIVRIFHVFRQIVEDAFANNYVYLINPPRKQDLANLMDKAKDETQRKAFGGEAWKSWGNRIILN